VRAQFVEYSVTLVGYRWLLFAVSVNTQLVVYRPQATWLQSWNVRKCITCTSSVVWNRTDIKVRYRYDDVGYVVHDIL